MMPQSLSSTAGVIKRNIRYSQPSLSGIENHVRYSRHLSFQYKRTPSNKRLRLIIHTTIRSPKNNRHQKENKSTHSVRYYFFQKTRPLSIHLCIEIDFNYSSEENK